MTQENKPKIGQLFYTNNTGGAQELLEIDGNLYLFGSTWLSEEQIRPLTKSEINQFMELAND